MRDLIALVEDSQAQGLSALSAGSVIGVLAHHTPRDIVNSWIARAYDAAGGGTARLAPEFVSYLESEVERVKRDLSGWIANPTPLMRGLREPPKENEPLGVHWTDKKITAQDYGDGKYLLQAQVSPNQIDWLYTLVRRIAWPKENEYSLKKGSIVTGTITGGNSGRHLGEFRGSV